MLNDIIMEKYASTLEKEAGFFEDNKYIIPEAYSENMAMDLTNRMKALKAHISQANSVKSLAQRLPAMSEQHNKILSLIEEHKHKLRGLTSEAMDFIRSTPNHNHTNLSKVVSELESFIKSV